MSPYYQRLIANGATPEEATRCVHADAIVWMENRERERRYEAEQIADAAPTTDFYERG